MNGRVISEKDNVLRWKSKTGFSDRESFYDRLTGNGPQLREDEKSTFVFTPYSESEARYVVQMINENFHLKYLSVRQISHYEPSVRLNFQLININSICMQVYKSKLINQSFYVNLKSKKIICYVSTTILDTIS